jgi:hypothetical protein
MRGALILGVKRGGLGGHIFNESMTKACVPVCSAERQISVMTSLHKCVQAKAISSGDSKAFAMATAEAFGGGNNANAYASSISQGIEQHGCGFYQQAFAQVS